jgi:hypothetical protein
MCKVSLFLIEYAWGEYTSVTGSSIINSHLCMELELLTKEKRQAGPRGRHL